MIYSLNLALRSALNATPYGRRRGLRASRGQRITKQLLRGGPNEMIKVGQVRLTNTVLDKRSDTSRYRLDGRVRDKWKEPEGAARHRRRSDTNVKVFEWRIDGENRAGEVHGYRTHLEGLSAATKHGTFRGRCSCPIEFPVW